MAFTLPWWRLVWLAAGVGIGLGLGTLLQAPPANEARAARTAPRSNAAAQIAAPQAAATVAPRFALSPVATPARPSTDAAGSTSAVASVEDAPGGAQAGTAGVQVEGSAIEPAGAPALQDGPLGERGDPAPMEAEGEAEAADVSEPDQPDVGMGTITNPMRSTGWALRSAPSTSARAVTSLPRGARVEILPETATGSGFVWLLVRTQNGQVGWVVVNAVLR